MYLSPTHATRVPGSARVSPSPVPGPQCWWSSRSWQCWRHKNRKYSFQSNGFTDAQRKHLLTVLCPVPPAAVRTTKTANGGMGRRNEPADRAGTASELCLAQFLLGIARWLGLSKKQKHENMERLAPCDRSLVKIFTENISVL